MKEKIINKIKKQIDELKKIKHTHPDRKKFAQGQIAGLEKSISIVKEA